MNNIKDYVVYGGRKFPIENGTLDLWLKSIDKITEIKV